MKTVMGQECKLVIFYESHLSYSNSWGIHGVPWRRNLLLPVILVSSKNSLFMALSAKNYLIILLLYNNRRSPPYSSYSNCTSELKQLWTILIVFSCYFSALHSERITSLTSLNCNYWFWLLHRSSSMHGNRPHYWLFFYALGLLLDYLATQC